VDTKKLIAHRGDNTNYPENTLIAIETALKAGAVAFEFDVQMTADHSLVVFHDDDVSRMTGKSDTKIFEINDADLNHLSIHEPEQFAEQHNPTQVSYVDDVLALLKQYPDVQAFLEIKQESLKHWGVGFVMDKLFEKLAGYEDQVSIISFDVEALFYTKKHSELKVGLVFEEYSERYKEIATELQPEFMVCYYVILPDENVWAGDWQWMVYTVNEVGLAKRLLERGDIDFVETDDIQLLLGA